MSPQDRCCSCVMPLFRQIMVTRKEWDDLVPLSQIYLVPTDAEQQKQEDDQRQSEWADILMFVLAAVFTALAVVVIFFGL